MKLTTFCVVILVVFTILVLFFTSHEMSELSYCERASHSNYINNLDSELNLNLDELNFVNKLVQKYPKDKDINDRYQIILYKTYFRAMILGKDLEANYEKKEYELKEPVVKKK